MITEKLSLVIPTYKREKQIIKILGSLNNQITNDIFIEVIFVIVLVIMTIKF